MKNNLRWLLLGRILRSFSTAFLTVIFPLYLARAGYSATKIGFVLAISGGVTVLLVAGVGLAADAFGRKRVIMSLAGLAVLGGIGMAWSPVFWVVVLASGLGGVGRGGGAGSGGSWGPVFPAEQPLVADSVEPQQRTRAFGQLSFVGVLAGAAGSLVAAIPDILHSHGMSWIVSYRWLFGASALIALAMVLATIPIEEPPHIIDAEQPSTPIPVRRLVGRLGFTNALNGLGFGFLGPLLTYWFYRRYGVGPAEIGIVYTVVNLASAFPYLWSAPLTRILGAVRTVVVTRAVSLIMLALMIWAPTFWIAGMLYTLRMAFNSLGMPARQSYVMGVSDARYRSRVSAFGSLPSQVTSMISPAIGGALMDSFLETPIVGAVLFMGLNLVAYYFAFRHVPAQGEEADARP